MPVGGEYAFEQDRVEIIDDADEQVGDSEEDEVMVVDELKTLQATMTLNVSARLWENWGFHR
jgi:hypothetical protein